MRVALLLLLSLPAPARAQGPAFLGPAGVLAARSHAVFLHADTELSGYPTPFLGWRMGLGGVADLGLEAGATGVAAVGRLHAKARLYESPARRWFAGARLRVEFKRHKQDFGEIFRPIDDLGFTLVPELSVGLRLGARSEHALHYAAFYYLDVDVRAGRGPEHYVLPGMIGYEGRLWRGLHLGVEAGVFFEVGQPRTAGEPLLKATLTLGYVL
jgi:hypothetical protein